MGKFRGLMLVLIGLIAGLILNKIIFVSPPMEVLASSLFVLVLGTLFIDKFRQVYQRTGSVPEICPRCSKAVTRTHRNSSDRFFSIFIPNLRRYSCVDPFCQWSGLVVAKEHSRSHSHSHSHPHSEEIIRS